MLSVPENAPPVAADPAMGSCNGAEPSFPCLPDWAAIAAVASSSTAIGIETFKSGCLVMVPHLRATRTAGRPGCLSDWRLAEGLDTPLGRQPEATSITCAAGSSGACRIV